MKHIKRYKKFFEDGVSYTNASTAGMGDVVNATVGSLPGVGGEYGSGDNSSYLLTKKQKKGNPSEVSDARFLDDVDDQITRVEETK